MQVCIYLWWCGSGTIPREQQDPARMEILAINNNRCKHD